MQTETVTRASRLCSQKSQDLLVVHQILLPKAARNDNHIELWSLSE